MKPLILVSALALAACGDGFPPVPEGAPTVTVSTHNSTDIMVLVRANQEADAQCGGDAWQAVPVGKADGVTTYACVLRT